MVRVGYLWHGPSCEVALQVKQINTVNARKGGINTVNALAFDDNHPSYEMAKPSKVCDVLSPLRYVMCTPLTQILPPNARIIPCRFTNTLTLVPQLSKRLP